MQAARESTIDCQHDQGAARASKRGEIDGLKVGVATPVAAPRPFLVAHVSLTAAGTDLARNPAGVGLVAVRPDRPKGALNRALWSVANCGGRWTTTSA